MDLALLKLSALHKLAQQLQIEKWNSLPRPDLVAALRNSGIGTHPPHHGSPGMDALIGTITDLSTTISTLTAEIVSQRTERDREIVCMKTTIDELTARVLQLEEGASRQRLHVTPSTVNIPGVPHTSPMTYYSSVALHGTSGIQHVPHSHLHVQQTGHNSTGPRPTNTSAGTVQNRNGTGTSSNVNNPQTDSEWKTANYRKSKPSTQSSRRHTSTPYGTRTDNGLAEGNDPTARSVTSRFIKPTPVNESPNVLAGTTRVRRKVFFVGNVSPGCSATSLVKWCSDRDVDVFACSVSASRYLGTWYARVSVAEDEPSKITNKSFWPEAIQHTVHPWRFAD